MIFFLLDFEFAKKNGPFIQCVFNGDETAWKLQCFPNGKPEWGEDVPDAISMYLNPVHPSCVNKKFYFAVGYV